MILIFSRAHFKKLPQKKYRIPNFKNFYKDDFLHELDFKLSKRTIYKCKDDQYDMLTSIFRMVLDKHASIKSRKLEEITHPSCQRN